MRASDPSGSSQSSHEMTTMTGKGDSGAQTFEVVTDHTTLTTTQPKDKAAALLEKAQADGHRVVVTPEDNKRILRQIDLIILPILLSVYGLQSLDKTSLSYASVFGLITDTHLVGQQYSWTGSIVYLAQLVCQPLVALALVKLPIGRFTGCMVFTWAIILCGMVGAKNFTGLMITRFLLGSAESAIAPCFIAITNMWYRRSEQTNRNASWYAMLGVVNILGSLLTYGLGHITSEKLHSYQIIFLFCGLLTACFSIVVFLFLPDSPMQARFLKGDDKLIAIERLRMNQQGISSREWKWEHVKEAFLDPKTWCWFSLLTAISIPSGGISTFGPLIIKAFGFSSFQTILFNMPFGACQIVATIGGAWLATRYKVKSPVLILLCIPPIIGIIMLMVIPYSKPNRGALLAGYYLISFYPGISPLIYSWSQQNSGGDTKKKVIVGIMFVGASTGNVIGPHLFQPSEAPHYSKGLHSNLILFIVIILLVCVTAFYLRLLNRRHAAMRVALGKPAVIVDLSMETTAELAARGEMANELEGEGGRVGEKAFDDVTDLVNEDFIYVY